MARPRRTGALLAGLALAVLGCTADPAPSAEQPTPSPTAPDTPPATAPAGPAGPTLDQPLLIVAHRADPLVEVTEPRARRIVARVGPTLDPAEARAAVRAVARGGLPLAVVPAQALGPDVRAATVDGVDPVLRPAAYPIRTPATAPSGRVVTMTVVGDIMLGRGVARAAAASGDPVLALRPLQRRLARADLTVGNLESTLSRAGAPTQQDAFAADPAVARGLRDVGFDVLSLANNHVGDFGDWALVQTVRRLHTAGLRTFGAGPSVEDAWQPAVVRRHGVRFGFLGFNAIGETPAVAPGRPGAVSVGMPPRTGPLDHTALRRFETALRRLDRQVDVVVAMPHWGEQYTHRPWQVQHRVARRLVRAGADLVVGGHPHWIQGAEMVRGRLVAHSLGNFVFDMDFMRQTMEGAMLELTFWGDQLKAAEFVPYVMDGRFAPRLVSGERAAEVLSPVRTLLAQD